MKRLASALVAAAAAVLTFDAHAQVLPGGAQLGMTVTELRQAVPPLKPVARPAHVSGFVGNWSGPEVTLAGVWMTPTFFFRDGQLGRVEYVAAPGSYDALLAWGRSQWGAELASQSPEGAYATWADGELGAYLQQAGAQVRLVLKRRLVKDASEL